MEVGCNGLNIIFIITIIKKPLLKPFVRVVIENIKYSDSKETDNPHHE
jgi:hypothetical protein